MGEAARRQGYRLVRILAEMVRSALRRETDRREEYPSAPSSGGEGTADGAPYRRKRGGVSTGDRPWKGVNRDDDDEAARRHV